MKETVKSISGLVGILLVFVFSVLMLNTIKQYFSFQTDVGFLKFKQEVINNKYWLTFFYIHIFSIVICLLSGITQFSKQFLSEYKKAHRLIGKLYVYNILFINFPACLILGIFSNGGYLGIIGFLIQDFLWALFTISAVYYIKNRKLKEHKKFMILSYAITTTAITFRIIKNTFFDENLFSYELFYGLNVWLALLINLSIAFFTIHYKSKSLSLKSHRIANDGE
ncbi:MAG: uncharacterized protein JWQ25_481 [Daejeonella sp.]|nr:uncharacterized protein [Daejeonella sp.]